MDLHCNEVYSTGSSSSGSEGNGHHYRQQQQQQQQQQQSHHQQKSLNRHVESPTRYAVHDPALASDRVLKNLLEAEERHGTTTTSYFGTVQDTITPKMWSIVTQWMLEVCEERSCQEEVFSLAVSYLDRFLRVCRISKNQLQLLGTACLLLASKLREPVSKALPAEVLVSYTDYSITLEELIKWELLVLLKLKWDMVAVTPQDFIALLVARLPLNGYAEPAMVTKHAQTFISLATREHHFTSYTASTIAAAGIAAALRGLDWCTQSGKSTQELLSTLHHLTSIEQDYLQNCLEQMEQIIQKTLEKQGKYHPNGVAGAATESEMMEKNWSQPQIIAEKNLEKARTPTDVRDVHF